MENALSTYTWTKEQRDYGWNLICISRQLIQIHIYPTITRSYIFLHYFFNQKEHKPYDFYILLLSSLFLSCKISDFYRPLKYLFKTFLKCCAATQKFVSTKKQKEILGDRDFSENAELTNDEFLIIGQCEIDLLNAINWHMHPIIPFDYFNCPERNLLGDKTDDLTVNCHKIMQDICLMIKHQNYLQFHPPAIAAAATLHSFSQPLEGKLKQWVEEQQQIYKDEILTIFHIIVEETQNLVPVNK